MTEQAAVQAHPLAAPKRQHAPQATRRKMASAFPTMPRSESHATMAQWTLKTMYAADLASAPAPTMNARRLPPVFRTTPKTARNVCLRLPMKGSHATTTTSQPRMTCATVKVGVRVIPMPVLNRHPAPSASRRMGKSVSLILPIRASVATMETQARRTTYVTVKANAEVAPLGALSLQHAFRPIPKTATNACLFMRIKGCFVTTDLMRPRTIHVAAWASALEPPTNVRRRPPVPRAT